jgi:hypothetical protein
MNKYKNPISGKDDKVCFFCGTINDAHHSSECVDINNLSELIISNIKGYKTRDENKRFVRYILEQELIKQ